MENNRMQIYQNIFENLSDGVIVIGFDSKIDAEIVESFYQSNAWKHDIIYSTWLIRSSTLSPSINVLIWSNAINFSALSPLFSFANALT